MGDMKKKLEASFQSSIGAKLISRNFKKRDSNKFD
jgi:hypothetical protein